MFSVSVNRTREAAGGTLKRCDRQHPFAMSPHALSHPDSKLLCACPVFPTDDRDNIFYNFVPIRTTQLLADNLERNVFIFYVRSHTSTTLENEAPFETLQLLPSLA